MPMPMSPIDKMPMVASLEEAIVTVASLCDNDVALVESTCNSGVID